MTILSTDEVPAPAATVVCFYGGADCPEIGDPILLDTREHGPWSGEIYDRTPMGQSGWTKLRVMCREPLVT